LEIIPTLPSFRSLRFEEEQAVKAAKVKEDSTGLEAGSTREGWVQREEGLLSKTLHPKWAILHEGKLSFYKTKNLRDIQQTLQLYSDSLIHAEPARKNAAMLFSIIQFEGEKKTIVFVKDGQERDQWIDTINSVLPSLPSHKGGGGGGGGGAAKKTTAKMEEEPPAKAEEDASPWGSDEPVAASLVEKKEEMPVPAPEDELPPPPPEDEAAAAAALSASAAPPAADGPRELTKAERDAAEREEISARAEAQAKKDKENKIKKEQEEKERKDKSELIRKEKTEKVKKDKEEKEAKERELKEKKAKEESDKKAKAEADKAEKAEKAAAAAEKAAHDKAEKEKVLHDKEEKERADKAEKAEKERAEHEKAEREKAEQAEKQAAEKEAAAAAVAAASGDPDLPPPPEDGGDAPAEPPADSEGDTSESKEVEEHHPISGESVYVRALFDLETDVETDLKFKTGDVIRLITPNVDLTKLGEECEDPVWLNGELMTNLQPGQSHIGSFPSNYVALVKDHDD